MKRNKNNKERQEDCYAPSLEEIWGRKDNKGAVLVEGLTAKIRANRERDVPIRAPDEVRLKRMSKTEEFPLTTGSLEHRVTNFADFERD